MQFNFFKFDCYFKQSTKNTYLRAAWCTQKSVSAPKFATCANVSAHRKNQALKIGIPGSAA